VLSYLEMLMSPNSLYLRHLNDTQHLNIYFDMHWIILMKRSQMQMTNSTHYINNPLPSDYISIIFLIKEDGKAVIVH